MHQVLSGTRGRVARTESLSFAYTPVATAVVIVCEAQEGSTAHHYGAKTFIPLTTKTDNLKLLYNATNFQWGGRITRIAVVSNDPSLNAGITVQQYYYFDLNLPTIEYKREITPGDVQPIIRLLDGTTQ